MNNKVMVAMSGGVDSAVSAYIVQQQGFECAGVTMTLFDENDVRYQCSTADSAAEAQAVANKLGIPHEIFEFKADFDKLVVKKFIAGYESGLTPNPCIECNRHLKFKRLAEYTEQKGFYFIATGHYVRVEKDETGGKYLLKKALDSSKDQSYVLYHLTQQQLAHIKFPLGELTKKEVRAIAAAQNFANANKSESQDICFIPDGDYAAYIERYTEKPAEPGDFLDTGGNVIGHHNGQIRYTVGQRRGLGVSAPTPLYVLDKDVSNNTVTLGTNDALFSKHLVAGNVNWVSGEPPAGKISALAKIRYKHHECPATAWMEGDKLYVEFDDPQRATTPGQAVVLYDGDIVLGGGTILAKK